jgi:putative ABC transport system substrate-binding protein
MKRRDFMMGLLLGAATRPVLAQAPAKQHRIAFVSSAIPADQLTGTAGPLMVRRFFGELRGRGYSEGGNLVVERYSAEGQPERYADLAYDVVSRNPEVIVTDHDMLLRVLKTTTGKIPVVGIMSDLFVPWWPGSLAGYPSYAPFVSLVTGPEIYGKQLQMLKDAVPSAARIACLFARVDWGLSERALSDAGDRLGISLIKISPSDGTAGQIRSALTDIAQQQPDAAIVSPEVDFLAHRRLIVEWAERARLPVMYPVRDYVELGGLMAYGPDLVELGQHLADDVDRILNGTKPDDIPIYQPAKFEFLINLKTANALGLSIRPTLLDLANEVIE